MNERLQSAVAGFLDHARRWVLTASLLGVALHMDPTAQDTTTPKLFWFALAGGLIPALSFLRLWWGERLRLPPPRLLLALAALAGIVTLSYLFSPYKAASNPGWQAWLLSAALLVALVDLLADEDARPWALNSLAGVAALAGAWSLAQHLNLDPTVLGRLSRAAFGSRIAGPLGNPNFAGGFFVLLLPVLLQQALCCGGPWRRRAYSLASLLALMGLALSASKAAFLGLGVALAVAGHLFYWSLADAALRHRALKGLGVFIGAIVLVTLALLPSASRQRLLGGPAAWQESVQFRAVTWKGAAALLGERPLLGWGPGTFSVAYPSHRPPEAMAAQSQHSYEVTHPENWVLQCAAETGLLGLAALLAVLWFLLHPLRALARGWSADPAVAGLALALLAAVAGSLACNLASLDLFLPSTLLPLLLLLAFGVVLGAERAPAVAIHPENYARLMVSVGLGMMATVPVVQAQLRWQSSRLLKQGSSLAQAGSFVQAEQDFHLAADMDPLNFEARYFYARSLVDQGAEKHPEALKAYEALGTVAPDYVLIHAAKARLYEEALRLSEAEEQWRKQLSLDPYFLPAVQALSSLLAREGRLAEAEAVLQEALPRFPQSPEIAANLEALRKARAGKGHR